MIEIKKNKHPPVVKFTKKSHQHAGKVKWKVGRKKLIKDYNDNPARFQNGKYAFNFDYGYKKYRKALLKQQGQKCCYCEKPVDNGSIEHYRPKSAYQQAEGDALVKPGYFWLAYEWSNMLVSCHECNSGQKGNLFPVNGSTRALYPSDCNGEEKVIINPAEGPTNIYISFNLDQPVGVDADGRGNENIRIFNLKNRGDIKGAREDKLRAFITEKKIASLTSPFGPFTKARISQAKKLMKKAQYRKEPFAGMIIENIRKGLV